MIKAIAEIEHRPYLLLGIAAAGAVLYIRHNAAAGAAAVGTGGPAAVQPGGLAGFGATGSTFQTGTDPSVLSAIQSAFGQLYGQVNGAITGQPGPNGLLDPNAPVGLTNAQFAAIQAQNVANGTAGGQNTLGGTGGYSFQQAQALLSQQQSIANAEVKAAGLSTNPAYGCQGFGCVLPAVSTIGNAIGKIGSLFTGGIGSIFGGGGGGSTVRLPSGGVVTGVPAGASTAGFTLGGSYSGN